jgi:hypothetical protein
MFHEQVPMEQKDEIQGFLNDFFSTSSCSWCKDHNRRLYGKHLPLCGSCKGIQKLIRKYERLAREHPPKSARSFDRYAYELAIANRMKALALQDGSQFGDIHSRPVDALDLEHILVEVSRIAVRRELFDNEATFLDQSFTKSQQRLLFFMMSEIVRAHRCKHRAYIAGNTLPDDW